LSAPTGGLRPKPCAARIIEARHIPMKMKRKKENSKVIFATENAGLRDPKSLRSTDTGKTKN
jgi:hypothetical protein